MNVILEIEAIEEPCGNHAVRVLPVTRSTRRPDLNLDYENPVQHLELLTKATSICILKCEKEGMFKQGEAIRKVITTIEKEYVDTSNDVTDYNPNEIYNQQINNNSTVLIPTPEELLADIRNKLSPASHLIALVTDYFDGNKKAYEFEELHEHIKKAIPKAEESIEYVRKFKL